MLQNILLLFGCLPTTAEAFSTALKMSTNTDDCTSSVRNLKGCVNMALSVDGFIAGRDGNMEWLDNHPLATDGGDMGFGEFLAEVDVMVMGRNTFDTVVGFGKDVWPYGTLPIVVWTRKVDNVKVPKWIEEKKSVSTRASVSPVELWRELEAAGKYKKVYIDGGMTIQSFMKVGLIHEMLLSRIPILLGEGIPLFTRNDTTMRRLKHISTRSYDNGIVSSKYVVMES
jgi:dihydrofolate reductase